MRKIAILFVVLLLFIAGCNKQVETRTTRPFVSGTNAVEFNFVEGSPPPEVYDGGNFPFEVALILENRGEYDIPAEKIYVDLAGFYPADFNSPVISKHPSDNLDKAYIDSEGNTIPGTVTYLTFNNFSFKGSLKANNEYKVRANICYVYGTYAQADLCVLDDVTKPNDKVCKVTEKKGLDVSSGPVQVENFEESVAGTDKVTFSFEITQRGSGLVSLKESRCSDGTIDKNKIWVEVDSGLPGLSCSGISDGSATSGYTTLYGGRRMIRCTQDTSAGEIQGKDFTKKVNIKLVYDYKEHKERNILVKHTT